MHIINVCFVFFDITEMFSSKNSIGTFRQLNWGALTLASTMDMNWKALKAVVTNNHKQWNKPADQKTKKNKNKSYRRTECLWHPFIWYTGSAESAKPPSQEATLFCKTCTLQVWFILAFCCHENQKDEPDLMMNQTEEENIFDIKFGIKNLNIFFFFFFIMVHKV